ncbi:MAG: excinuclease ABC subunit UvrA [Solirubrobacterales bacterium]|nr:excinuclease ABC subunit UvrA [Solirubrobacterales bacterium]MCB8969832.1 excinuclease ABC subunit UvrA [Thermoleophilales bacterium]
MGTSDRIVVSGAREHNLRGVDVELPRDALVVMTGLSGSGKSSLAFDTIYAEGQRRYVESLSAYARQFLGQMDKPDVDSIEGLSPAISIDQKTTSRNPRSTVGTVTEIYDYLRLLWSRIGKPHCFNCGEPISGQSVEQITDRVLTLPEGTKFMVCAPVVRERKGEYGKLLEDMRQAGYARAVVDGELRRLDEEITLDKRYKHDIAIVIDRLVMKESIRKRLSESIEAATGLADGLVEIELVDGEAEVAGAQVLSGPSAGKRGETLVFSERFACLNCGTSMPEIEPRIFSFNSPHGACERCHGLGYQRVIDPELCVPDPTLSISEGALASWMGAASRYYRTLLEAVCKSYDIDADAPWQDLPDADRRILLDGTGSERHTISYKNRFGRRRSYTARFEGITHGLERRYQETDSEKTRERIEGLMALQPCPACGGARLRPESLAVTVGGLSIADYSRLSARAALDWIGELELTETERAIARLVVREVQERLSFLVSVGIGYLTLERAATTLSGGEAQRIRLATQIGSSLVGVLYILDEPSIGLHQRDNAKLIATLERLRDLGNTVIVVEHDEGTMRAADYLVDLGPGAGEHGGRVVAAGTPDEVIRDPASLTGEYLSGKRVIPVPEERRKGRGELVVRGAREHNLKGVDAKIPVGTLTCVTGVSGSGKSTLVNETLYRSVANRLHRARTRPGAHDRIEGLKQIDKVINIDQSPIGRTPRSNPATYTGVFDHIRQLFAKTKEARARGYQPGRFSFNVKGGRCEVCKGDGQIKIEMHFLPDVYVPCEQCHGRRYNRETLEVRFKGKSIADVLEMPVEEAVDFFAKIPKIHRRLKTLHDVGLDYIRLGQPATTLSGGEAQRVKLATELSKVATGETLYILDEPTTGLHFADVERLLDVLARLVDAGNTVVVIEHNLDVIKSADWIVDLGPEGGDGGGEIIAAGTPEQVATVAASYTGRFLEELVEPAVTRTRKREPVAA